MATWDSADLLARAKMLARRATTDAHMTDAKWYQLLTEAQHEWLRELSSHIPDVNYCVPTLLTTADSGETYVFPDPYAAARASGSFDVFALELYTAKNGSLMRPGPYHDDGADYVFEGRRIRFPLGRTKTFSSGPYGRYVAAPADLSGSIAPTMLPEEARALLPVRACIKWAAQGNDMNPGMFMDLENRVFYGEPERGIVGILGSLQTGDLYGGAAGYPAQDSAWYHGIETGGWTP